mgnify:CR=1 FL=1
MPHSFSLNDSRKTRLWDFGWFDLSSSKILGVPDGPQDSTRVLAEFLRDPISQRSFCNRGPWGESIERHGPFLHDRLTVEWFRRITIQNLKEQIQATLENPEFTEPPDPGQCQPVNAWVEAVEAHGDDIFALDVPHHSGVRVEWWDCVWFVYREFAVVSPDRGELAIGVLGYD